MNDANIEHVQDELHKQKQIHDDEDSVAWSAVPYNKPRHIVFADEAIGKLIKVARLVKFQIDTPVNADVSATFVLEDPRAGGHNTFKGKGPTMGHALREALDNVNVVYPLGEEYGAEARE